MDLAPRHLVIVVGLLAALGSSCSSSTTLSPEPCVPPAVEQSIRWDPIEGVDLLLVIDDSVSMGEEQLALGAALPRLVDILATGDYDQDGDTFVDGELGDPDFEPIADLHLGVVTTDMGTGGVALATCDRPELGDDGLLRADPSCGSTAPPFLSFDPAYAMASSDRLAAALCATDVGTAGCGIEQPLEAALKALSPAAPTEWTAPGYVAPTFLGGTLGHGDRENDGFLRRRSLLAIVVLTDENDCSVRDPALFDPTGPYADTDINLRCATYPEALQPVERYVEGLVQLRERPGMVVFSVITGVPVDLAPGPAEALSWDALDCEGSATCDDRLRERPDPAMPTRLMTSCASPDGSAYPPTRLIQVARGLDARGAAVDLSSICGSDWDGAFDELLRQLRSGFSADCFPRPPIPRGADGRIDCTLRVVLPEGRECADLPGSVPFLEDGSPVSEDGRAVCALEQRVPSDRSPGAPLPTDLEPGWYYDDFSRLTERACPSRFRFTRYPPSGSVLRLECSAASGAGVVVGTPCDPSDDAVCPTAFPRALVCDPVVDTCALACMTDDDCAAGGLDGFVCDPRPLGELDPRFSGVTDPHHVCVDPTCG